MITSQRLETARLTLRAPVAADWETWAAFIATDRSKYIGGPMSRWDAWRSLGHVIGHWTLRGYGVFVITEKGSEDIPLGSVGPWYPEGWPEPELSWSMWTPEAEGRGYAHEAAIAARAHAYGPLGWTTAVSYIDPRNTRSVALAERLGARPDWAAKTPNDDADVVFRHPAPEAAS